MVGPAAKFTFVDQVFQPEAFFGFEGSFNKTFMADVTVFVTPSEDSISLEILSIIRDPDRREIESFLRGEDRYQLEVMMRQHYVDSIRDGVVEA